MLLGHLLERGGHVRFRTELVGFELDGSEVRARLRPRDGGAPAYDVHARYLWARTVRAAASAGLSASRWNGSDPREGT